MKLKDIDVNFSFTNADDLERLEKATKKVEEEAEAGEKEELSLPESIRKECQIINDFLDETFGEGIAQKLFKGKNDLQEHMEIFTDIMNAKIEMTKATQNLYDTLENKAKYMPSRETRRYNNRYNKGRR